MTDDDALVRLLVERLRRHRPKFLSVHRAVLVLRRLIRHARWGEGGCIVWARSRNNDGYGRMNIWLHGQRFKFYVHRLAYQFAHDPNDIPWYREISHKCDRPPCFNPDCLEKVRRPVNRKKSAENTNRKRALRAQDFRIWGSGAESQRTSA